MADSSRSPDDRLTGSCWPNPAVDRGAFRKVKNHVLAPLALLVVGCVSNWEPVQTEYVFKDWPPESGIEVLFTNHTRDQLCLLPKHWPNQAGKINQASEYVFLLVAGERFPIADFNTGYCPSGCATVVRPGETVAAAIAYDDFQLPADLRHLPKQLELPVAAYAAQTRRDSIF